MTIIDQNIENLKFAVSWNSYELTKDQQESVILKIEEIREMIKTYMALNRKGI